MLHYIKRILIFLIPVYVYWILVILIDPYDFINISHIIPDKTKITALNRDGEASPRGNILWKYIQFKRHPSSYVIFGDSQGRKIKKDLVKSLSGKDYFNFCVPGANYQTIFNNFWFAAKKAKLKKVFFQVGFMNYNNKRSYSLNHFATKYLNNPYMYFTSQNIFYDCYYNAMFEITGDSSYVLNPYNQLSYHELDSLSQNYLNMFFDDYSYPVEFQAEFEKIANYCKKNDISVNFIILPTYTRAHDYIQQLDLKAEEKRFRQDLSKYGKVYDFNQNNSDSQIRENFIDYFHPRQDLLDKCVEAIWSEKKADSTAIAGPSFPSSPQH